MRYKKGESNGRKYEFYGCSRFPNCRGTVEMDEVDEYDDGIQPERDDKSNEEGDEFRDILLGEGYDWEEASYAKHMWEKD